MKRQIILTLVVIAAAAFLGGYGLGSLNDNSNPLTTIEIINVSSESNTTMAETLTIGFIPVEKDDELTKLADKCAEELKASFNQTGIQLLKLLEDEDIE